MGKNHRHSKKLKSEKNKVHIKSKTKFLPKGQNVTNTAFKIRAIVVQEQLKDRQESSLTNKKRANIDAQSIDELVSKLKHFNDTIKTESCQDLKDLINSNPFDSIQIYLSAILQNGSALVQDRERKVRRAAIKLLHAVFEKMSLTALRPFFGYILTNLKCAMTNINKHVQEDSLLLLDAILEHQSRLIAENFSDFFPNFLMLISKSKDNSNEKSLSLNLEGRITSVKWRVKVLTRLHGILSALVENRQKDKLETRSAIDLDAKGTVFVPIHRDISIYENIDAVLFARRASLDANFERHLATLIRLLHDVWLETVPEKGRRDSAGTVLATEDAVAVFVCVVHILRLLRQFGNEAVFGEGTSTAFLDSLMANFPYYAQNGKNLDVAKDLPRHFNLDRDPGCVEQNLAIVHIFVTSRMKNARNSPRHKSLIVYIKNCLQPKFRLAPPSMALLIQILKEILLDDRTLSRKLGVNEPELMEDISDLYTSGRVPERFRFEILEILTSSRLQKQQWMTQLTDLLCESSISGKLIDAILDSCQRGETVVQDGVRKSLPRILENLPDLQIHGVESVDVARKNLASIFFYVPGCDEEIRNFKNSHPELAVSRFLANVLDLRSDMSSRYGVSG